MDEQAKLNLEEILAKDPVKSKICRDVVQNYCLADKVGFIGIHRAYKQIDYLGDYYVALIKGDANKVQKCKKKFNPEILQGFYSTALELAEDAVSSAEFYAKLAKPMPEESANKIIKEKEGIEEELIRELYSKAPPGSYVSERKMSEFERQLHVKAARKSREEYIERATTNLRNANYYRSFATGIKYVLDEIDSFANNERRLNTINNAMLDIAEKLEQLDVKVQFGELPLVAYNKEPKQGEK